MNVVFTTEHHYLRTPDGIRVDGKCDYRYLSAMLEVFDEVLVYSRVVDAPAPPSARAVEGPGVRLIQAPDFVATAGLVRAVPGLARSAWAAAGAGDAFILHAPGVMATVLREALRLRRRAFAAEVVGDPRESLDPSDRVLHASRMLAARNMAGMVRDASALRYVTRTALQRSYPPSPGAAVVVASDVSIADALFDVPLPAVRPDDVLDLGFVGLLDRAYKGLDVLLEALVRTARPHRLDVVGDGGLRPGLELLARQLGLGGRVRFLGRLPPGDAVFEFLRGRDLQVQPSRTEGLPRGLLEGMAVGLPCLSTPVGGVPELLDAGELVRVDDPDALARAIDALAADRARRATLSQRNRERARAYRASAVRDGLRAFYAAVRDTARPR